MLVTASKLVAVEVKIPLVRVRVPPTVSAIPRKAPLELFKVRLLNVAELLPQRFCNKLPFKLTVPLL